jgi:hypothetical protein
VFFFSKLVRGLKPLLGCCESQDEFSLSFHAFKILIELHPILIKKNKKMTFKLKKHFISCFICLSLFLQAQEIFSPNRTLFYKFELIANGVPSYQLSYKGKAVIAKQLGIRDKDLPSFMEGFSLQIRNKKSVDNSWNPVLGEEKHS